MASYDYELSASSSAERKRSVRKRNFTNEEDKLLTKIIEPFSTVMDNKSNSSSARNAKNVAWTKIATLYNALTTQISRTEPELRKRWDNNKTKVRNQMKRQHLNGGANTFNGVASPEYQDNDGVDQYTNYNCVMRVMDDSRKNNFDSAVVADDVPATDSNSEDNSNCIETCDYDDEYENAESPNDAGNSFEVVAVEGDVMYEGTPSCSSDHKYIYPRARRKTPNSSAAGSSLSQDAYQKAKAEYFKFKKHFQIKSLQIAEEQNERAKVLFDLDVRKRHLELELLEAQIAAQKKL